MSMQRMFTVVCDRCYTETQGAEWYASLARQNALEEGFHLRGNDAICSDCWESGSRW